MKTRRPWYQIRNAEKADEAEILIYEQIGRDWFGEGISAEQFVSELGEIKASTLNVRINSVGGLVFEGLAIANALMRHKARVVTHVDGIAASIASVVALAGDEIRIAENAFLMIHNAWGVVIGNRNEMIEMAATLEKLDGSIADTYMRKTGKDQATVRGWMDAETWFTAKDAKEVGLVDHIDEKQDLKASMDLSRFAKVPDTLAACMQAVRRPAPTALELDPEISRLAVASATRTLARTL